MDPVADVAGDALSPDAVADAPAGDGRAGAAARPRETFGLGAGATDNVAEEAGGSRGHERPGGYPCSLLRRVQEPPTSPRTRAKTPLLQLVVVPRTTAIQAAEDALSLALLALVLGTRPAVTPAMMLQHLHVHYSITEERVSVRWTRPDDFLVRFSHQEDLDLVLSNQKAGGRAICTPVVALESFNHGLRRGISLLGPHRLEGDLVPCMLGGGRAGHSQVGWGEGGDLGP